MKYSTILISFFFAINLAKASSAPSFSCLFTEPFVSLYTSPMGSYFVNMADRPQKLEFLGYKIISNKHQLSLRAKQPVQKILLNIVKGKGSDGMSDRQFPFIGSFNFKVTALTGGCVRYPDGTSPRKVSGVQASDKLNLRASPSNTSKILASYALGTYLWAAPENAINGWVKVTGILPNVENDRIELVTGYVVGRYLGAI